MNEVADLTVRDEGLRRRSRRSESPSRIAPGLHVGEIRAGARLGHGDAEQNLAGDRPGEVAAASAPSLP